MDGVYGIVNLLNSRINIKINKKGSVEKATTKHNKEKIIYCN